MSGIIKSNTRSACWAAKNLRTISGRRTDTQKSAQLHPQQYHGDLANTSDGRLLLRKRKSSQRCLEPKSNIDEKRSKRLSTAMRNVRFDLSRMASSPTTPTAAHDGDSMKLRMLLRSHRPRMKNLPIKKRRWLTAKPIQRIPVESSSSSSSFSSSSSPTWFSPLKLRIIQRECVEDILRLDRNASYPNDDPTGLEHYSVQHRRQRRETRRQLTDAVDAIQDFQSETGVPVPDLMAYMCQKLSAPMVAMARLRGIAMCPKTAFIL